MITGNTAPKETAEMTTTKRESQTPVPPSWRRAAVTFWWVVLVLAVAVSAYGNVRHAEMVAPQEHLTVARWIAGALPLGLLIMVEGIALGTRGGAHGRPRLVGLSIIVPLAVIVLASSYVGLLSLVTATELFTASVAPLNYGLAAVPDLLMVAATVYVMSLRSGAKPTARVTSPGRWSRIGDNLMSRAERLTEVREPQVTAVGHAARADEPQAPAQVNRAPLAHTGQDARPTAHRDAAQPARPATQAPEPVQRPTPTEDHRIAAQRLVDGKRATQPVETVANVLAAADAGMSKREIETATGVPASTAARIVSRAKELEDTAGMPDSTRVLAAVG